MKHIDWNYGVIDDVLAEFLIPSNGKTVKTLCGKRVAYANIDNHNPTCLQCIVDKQTTEAIVKELQSCQTVTIVS